jgi:hypothetical protein
VSVSVEREGTSVVVKIPMRIKRVAGRMEIITPEGLADSQPLKAAPQEPLITALARAYCWQEMIDIGRYASIAALAEALAEALGVDRCYVRRILGLACLAPDIVEAIVRGQEPSGLSLKKLVKGMPMGWAEQRRLAGFSPKPHSGLRLQGM